MTKINKYNVFTYVYVFMIIDINVKHKVRKLLAENICDLRLSKEFLGQQRTVYKVKILSWT